MNNTQLVTLTLRQDEIDWLLRVVRIAKHETENALVEKYLSTLASPEDED